MKKYRRFCQIVLMVVLSIVLFNGIVWNLITRPLLTRHEGWYTGDLARMGYLSGYTQPRQNTNDLPRRHIEMAGLQGDNVDLVTIGDSFSQGGASGHNRYYQDYLASIHEMDVLNIPRYPGAANLVEQIAILLNSGFFDRIRPRYLVLQIAERNAYKLGGKIDFGRSEPLEEMLAYYQKGKAGQHEAEEDGPAALPQVGFLNSGNLKWLFYNVLYPFEANAFVSDVYKVPLSASLFSGPRGDTLLYLDKDVRNLKRYDADSLARVNDNLNHLAVLLRQRGIEFYFMPAVDKSNLYRPYVLDDHYPESRFFEHFRGFVKDYRFIDTKAILQSELEKGELDIFYLDDTHWSWRASLAISQAIRFH
jgi:hypothetical protein